MDIKEIGCFDQKLLDEEKKLEQQLNDLESMKKSDANLSYKPWIVICSFGNFCDCKKESKSHNKNCLEPLKNMDEHLAKQFDKFDAKIQAYHSREDKSCSFTVFNVE